MTRWLYTWLLKHHPAPFRDRFSAEMAAVYDEAVGTRGGWTLVASAAASLVRQQVRSVWAAPPAQVVADARAFDQRRRYLALELQLAGQGLGLFALALVLDRRLVMTGALLLFSAGLVLWRFVALYRHQRTYLQRLARERWLLRYEAEQARQQSLQSVRHSLYCSAVFAMSIAFHLALFSRVHAGPLGWPSRAAFAVWFLLTAIHHRRVEKTLAHELAALDEVAEDVTAGPLGLN